MPFEPEVRPDGSVLARYISKRQLMGAEAVEQLILRVVGPGLIVQASRLRERLRDVPRATYDAVLGELLGSGQLVAFQAVPPGKARPVRHYRRGAGADQRINVAMQDAASALSQTEE